MKCRSCNAEIVFLPTRAGKENPVDIPSLSGIEREMYDKDPGYFLAHRPVFDHTRHVSHFATCPDAKRFKKTSLKEDK